MYHTAHLIVTQWTLYAVLSVTMLRRDTNTATAGQWEIYRLSRETNQTFCHSKSRATLWQQITCSEKHPLAIMASVDFQRTFIGVISSGWLLMSVYFFLTRGESTALPWKQMTERASRDHSGSQVVFLNFPPSCSMAKLRRQNSS